jgi:DNA-binding NtrC family response regulator
VRLLRVIETGVLRRLGGERSVSVDVRVVAATHRDLSRMVRDGQFREDLYYRLKGAVLEVPPLRDRVSDLEALVVHFLDQIGGARPMPTRAAWRALQAYAWPGNVRELRAEVARWVVFCEDRVELEDLAPEIRSASPIQVSRGGSLPVMGLKKETASRPLAEILAEVEQQVISKTLREHSGNLSRTARELGIDRNTLKRKLPRAPAKPPRKRAK